MHNAVNLHAQEFVVGIVQRGKQWAPGSVIPEGFQRLQRVDEKLSAEIKGRLGY
jgi:hypothetical protein